MSEEEKKAIEKFENLLTKHFENKKIDTVDYLDYFEGITILNLIDKQQKEIENIKEYINSPEFLDWNLGFKLIDELEYRKDRINELLGE